jgi:hypothetical protein
VKGTVGDYGKLKGVDPEEDVHDLKARWVMQAKVDVDPTLVTLCLVKRGPGVPVLSEEAAAKTLEPLEPRQTLREAGVADGSSLLAFISAPPGACGCRRALARTHCYALPRLVAATALQREMERLSQEQERLSSIALPLLGALFQRNVRYSDSKRQSRVSSTLKKKLTVLERAPHGKLRCMLLNELLPYSSVIAAHLLKREWDYLSRELADVDDVDNVRNGLLLYKPLEWAFDTSRLVFVWDGARSSFVAHVLDPNILDVRLVDKAQAELKERHKTGDEAILGDRCFRDVHGIALVLPLAFSPWRRCLCFHAHLARDEALRRAWLKTGEDFQFEDFWSEGVSSIEKVRIWLSAQQQHPLLEAEESDSESRPQAGEKSETDEEDV